MPPARGMGAGCAPDHAGAAAGYQRHPGPHPQHRSEHAAWPFRKGFFLVAGGVWSISCMPSKDPKPSRTLNPLLVPQTLEVFESDEAEASAQLRPLLSPGCRSSRKIRTWTWDICRWQLLNCKASVPLNLFLNPCCKVCNPSASES